MGTDYPAAHSMDTTWFAVDGAGHVGVFHSGEDGPVPKKAGTHSGEGHVYFATLRQLRGEPEPDEEDEDDDDDWDAADEEADRLGLFVYGCATEPLLAPYGLEYKPRKPLHVDRVPPELRRFFKLVQLPDARFGRDKRLQPVEHVPCFLWNEEEVAYLAGDGKTVRRLPGRKQQEYEAFCRTLREQHPEYAKGLRFEGLEETKEAPPPRRGRRGGKDGGKKR